MSDLERIVSTLEISRAWNVDVRTVESGLRGQNIPIIQLSPYRRGILKRHYEVLLGLVKEDAA